MKHREGFFWAAPACRASCLTRMLRGADDSEIARIVSFYDYLEIQPIGNNAFLIDDERQDPWNEEDLRDLNRRHREAG
jgi:DNA polymerase-3 subunit alpha (Gram-positive type)